MVTTCRGYNIFPEVGFTCSGSISGWVFGAQWIRQGSLFTELQIWRPTGDGHYTKVGNTTIMTASNSSQIYYYTLSAPLEFKAGDVLGYHQPNPLETQLAVYFEVGGQGERQTGYYYLGTRAANDLYIDYGSRNDMMQILVNVDTGELVCQGMLYYNALLWTDSPGCVRGFMSVERIRLFLRIDVTSSHFRIGRRQQISPEMNFSCDGMITKWIVGAYWFSIVDRYAYPELQIWRNLGNDTYQKVTGTHIFSPFAPPDSRNIIIEYSAFEPITIKAGDVLGVFLPDAIDSRLLPLSESGRNHPLQYYHTLNGRFTESPFDVIKISNVSRLYTTSYQPLVTVEFGKNISLSATILQ